MSRRGLLLCSIPKSPDDINRPQGAEAEKLYVLTWKPAKLAVDGCGLRMAGVVGGNWDPAREGSGTASVGLSTSICELLSPEPVGRSDGGPPASCRSTGASPRTALCAAAAAAAAANDHAGCCIRQSASIHSCIGSFE